MRNAHLPTRAQARAPRRRGLSRIVGKIDVLASSGLLRADETAAAVAEEFGVLRVDTVTALAPGAKPGARRVAARPGRRADLAVVGHEPGLGALVTWLVSGLSRSFLDLGKGGACLVELSGRIAPGEARLAWLLRPGQLRRLR
jgi:phosphohistidine phosphatase SixA